MDKDNVKGKAEQAKGTAKETAGKVTGNDQLKAEGTADKLKGKVQETYGKAKEKVKELTD